MNQIVERFREWEYEQERLFTVYERKVKQYIKVWSRVGAQKLSFVSFLAFRTGAVVFQSVKFALKLSLHLFFVGPTLVKRVEPDVEEEIVSLPRPRVGPSDY